MNGREFLLAATRPSGSALVGTLAVALGLWSGAAVLVTPGRLLAIDPGRLVDPVPSNRDNLVHATRRMLELLEGERRPLDVAIVGASSPVNALLSEAWLSDQLTRRVGAPIGVHDLSLVGLQTLDEVALVDALEGRVGGAIVVTTNHFKLGRHAPTAEELDATPRLPFDSPALDDEVARLEGAPRRRTGVWLVDHAAFFAPLLENALGSVLRGPRPAGRYTAEFERLEGEALEREVDRMLPLVLNRFARPERLEANLAVLGRLARRERARSPAELLFVEGTWHPRFVRAVEEFDDALLPGYRARMQRFAAENGVHYRDLSRAARLEAEDFLDLGHLGTRDARERWSRALVDELVPLLAARADEEGLR